MTSSDRRAMFKSAAKKGDYNLHASRSKEPALDMALQAKSRLVYRTQPDALERIFEVIRDGVPIKDPVVRAAYTEAVEKEIEAILELPENHFAPFVGWVFSITTHREDEVPTEQWMVVQNVRGDSHREFVEFTDYPHQATIFTDAAIPVSKFEALLLEKREPIMGKNYPATGVAVAMQLPSGIGEYEGVMHVRPVLVGPTTVKKTFRVQTTVAEHEDLEE